MTLTDRDRKIVLAIVPVVLLLAYWFLLLAPKRDAASQAGEELTKQEQRRDAARDQAGRLSTAKSSFASDYVELVRLGKAVPTAVDMPTLLVQLDSAARGTGIRFTRIAASEKQTAAPAAPPPNAPGSGDGSQPAAAGGQPAQSQPGKAAEAAGNATNTANNASAAAEQSGVNPGDASTSQNAREGSVPVGGGAPGGAAAPAPALDQVPLELEFVGDFFNLADFFHRLKRFVYVTNNKILVRGRLLTIDGLKFSSDPDLFPKIKAELTATVYLSPKTQGATAGASPQGPAPVPAGSPPSGGSQPTPASTPPAATAVAKP